MFTSKTNIVLGKYQWHPLRHALWELRRNNGREGTARTMRVHRIVFRARPRAYTTIFGESIICLHLRR